MDFRVRPTSATADLLSELMWNSPWPVEVPETEQFYPAIHSGWYCPAQTTVTEFLADGGCLQPSILKTPLRRRYSSFRCVPCVMLVSTSPSGELSVSIVFAV